MKLSLAGNLQHSFQGKAEKVKDAAKKDTDLAKQRARTIYVTINQTSHKFAYSYTKCNSRRCKYYSTMALHE